MKDITKALDQLEALLTEYLVKKMPALPDGIKEFIVKFSPYFTILMLVIAVPALLAILGFGSFLLPFAALGGALSVWSIISLVITILLIGLEIMALPGLFKRKMSAWKLIYYADLVALVQGLFSGNPVGAIIGSLIGLYVLFQVKSYYK